MTTTSADRTLFDARLPSAQPCDEARERARSWLFGILLLADVACALASCSAVVAMRVAAAPLGTPVIPAATFPFIFAALWALALGGAHAYRGHAIVKSAGEVLPIMRAALLVLVALALLAYTTRIDAPRSIVAVLLPLATVSSLLGRSLVRWRVGAASPLRTLIVGTAQEAANVRGFFDSRLPGSILPVGGTCEWEGDGVFETVVHRSRESRADAVLVATAVPPVTLRSLSWALAESGIQLLVAPPLFAVAGRRLRTEQCAGLPIVDVGCARFGGPSQLVKEVVDRVGGLLLVVVAAPLLCVVAALIVVVDGRPVLYRQTRVGRGGVPFEILKFRTMRRDADAEYSGLVDAHGHCGLVFKLRNDPRVTRLGRLLRRASLDELPQLFNVVGGSMSLVGPRPQTPDEVSKYSTPHRRRLLVKPGITGLWQVSGRSELAWEKAVDLDLEYVDNWSVRADLDLLGRTVKAVISGRGAY